MNYEHNIETYIKELKEYNNTTNIYSKKAYDKLDFHIQDSINLAQIITNTRKTIIDLGSGSGLPGIPISIINPNNTLFCIESKSRKTKFLNHIKKELNLTNLTIINQNIYEWIHHNKQRADVITAKAFGSIEKIIDIAKKIKGKDKSIYVPISTQQREKLNNKNIINSKEFLYFHKQI